MSLSFAKLLWKAVVNVCNDETIQFNSTLRRGTAELHLTPDPGHRGGISFQTPVLQTQNAKMETPNYFRKHRSVSAYAILKYKEL